MAKKNPNTNCLDGMRCPKCGSYGPLVICTRVDVLVHDDGTEYFGGGYEWDDDAPCSCEECKYSGVVLDFIEKKKKKKKKGAARHPATLQELMKALDAAGLTGATVGEDNDGQIVVYTNLAQKKSGKLADMG